MNFKELAENILTDLVNNGSMSDILLKTKIFATKKGDNELLMWVSKELDGYGEEKLPKYRNLICGLKVDVVVPFGRTGVVDFPIDMIEDDNARNSLSIMDLNMPIAEIENLCNGAKEDGIMKRKLPVFTYPYMSKIISRLGL